MTRRARALLGAVAVLVLVALGWLTRYQYVPAGPRLMRVQRWTGASEVLVGTIWRPVAAAHDVARDTSVRRRDTNPYADLVDSPSVR